MGLIPRLNVIAIGGAHQLPHFLPLAFQLDRAGRAKVIIFVLNQKGADDVRMLAHSLGYHAPETRVLGIPSAFRFLENEDKPSKVLRLLLNSRLVRNSDAILCAERTSTVLKRWPGSCPPLLHIPHGAGDRAVGFEKRIALFDKVLTAGPKDRDRMIAQGVARSEHCEVIGPIKLAAMALHTNRRPVFRNTRCTILYNPHFDRHLGTFASVAEGIIDAFAQQDRYNLVIAPHVRLAQTMTARERKLWESRSQPGKILIDMGSGRSVDMTYTLGSDLYIGDVSSQVYEFISRPRPCLFIDRHHTDWHADPDYAMWRFGPIITPNDDILTAVDRAFETFEAFRSTQVDAARDAFGSESASLTNEATARSVIEYGAEALESAIARSLPNDR